MRKTCCHTYPNDRLLQLYFDNKNKDIEEVVIPIQTIGFYNSAPPLVTLSVKVVIPIQTIGFYNSKGWRVTVEDFVVIPIQTIGFYNAQDSKTNKSAVGYHTYPNDRLLQQ